MLFWCFDNGRSIYIVYDDDDVVWLPLKEGKDARDMAASDEVRIVLKFYDMATSAAKQVLRRRSISPATSAPPSTPSSAPPSAPNTPAASGRTGSSSRANSSHRKTPACSGSSSSTPFIRLTSSAAANATGAVGVPSSSSRRSCRSTDTATGGASASASASASMSTSIQRWASPGGGVHEAGGGDVGVSIGSGSGSSTAEESGLLQQRMLALEEQVAAQEHWKLRAAAQMERMEAQIAALQKQQQSLNNSASERGYWRGLCGTLDSATPGVITEAQLVTAAVMFIIAVYTACSVANALGLI